MFKQFFVQLMQDKHGNYNLRELATLVFILIVIVSWIADQFLGFKIAEYMFYSFVSLICTALFGYSIEKRGTNSPDNPEKIK